jgi:hypothetical protein
MDQVTNPAGGRAVSLAWKKYEAVKKKGNTEKAAWSSGHRR